MSNGDQEEVIVKEKRLEGSGGRWQQLGGQQFFGGPSAGGIERASVEEEEEEEAIDEIIVTAVLPAVLPASDLLLRSVPTAFERLVSQPRVSDFARLMAKPVTAPTAPALPEIIVKGTRLAKLNVFAGAASIAALLGAKIAGEVSQGKLDATFAELMAQGYRVKPDTPVKTIPENPMTEIVVRGKRPRVVAPTMRGFFDLATDNFMLNPIFGAGIAPPVFARQTVKRPQRVSRKTPALRTVTQFEGLIPRVDLPTRTVDPFTRLVRRPVTALLPQPDLTGSDPGLVGFTGPSPGSFVFPGTAARLAGQCPPCEKGSKRKKQRKECYRKLVKETRNPSNDKVYKWAKINCDTGKEI